MRIYASILVLGLVAGLFPVTAQLTTTHSTVHLKAATSSQLLAVTQTSQEGEKPPRRLTQRRVLS